MQKVTISLESDLLEFVDQQANGDRDAYINSLLAAQRREILKQQLITALQEDISDPNYQAEVADWDSVAGDGLDA
jgi:hypothetical protein